MVLPRLREIKLCGVKSKRFLLLLGLYSLLFFAQCSYCYADVILTDSEATELLNEIELSKKDLQDVKTELESAKKELADVKSTYTEQKKSYEEQLEEAEKENQKLQMYLTVTATTSGVLLGILTLMLLL